MGNHSSSNLSNTGMSENKIKTQSYEKKSGDSADFQNNQEPKVSVFKSAEGKKMQLKKNNEFVLNNENCSF